MAKVKLQKYFKVKIKYVISPLIIWPMLFIACVPSSLLKDAIEKPLEYLEKGKAAIDFNEYDKALIYLDSAQQKGRGSIYCEASLYKGVVYLKKRKYCHAKYYIERGKNNYSCMQEPELMEIMNKYLEEIKLYTLTCSQDEEYQKLIKGK